MTAAKPARVFVGVFALLVMAALGAGGMYLYLHRGQHVPAAAAVTAAPAAAVAQEISVTLSPEAVSRAGLQTTRPTQGPVKTAIDVPGNVEPNAYGQVVVRSVAAGQVRSVAVELGTQVRRGDLLATIYSPELADTERTFLSMRSEYDAAHQRLIRLESLVGIGAASQQELETARAEHTRHTTDVESARAKLSLLGLTSAQLSALTESGTIDSIVRVTAPIEGLITARTINSGANIDASKDLFTVVDLSSVWIVGSLYERDLAAVQIGSAATVTSPAAQGRTWNGRVGYVDPQLDTSTRTAKVRIEVGNADRLLRLGMYVDVTLSPEVSRTALLISRTAVQTIGNQTVVYIADEKQAGRYVERPVALGPTAAADVEVLAGVSPTDQVVVAGSFMLRAERDRLGLPAPASVVHAQSSAPGPATRSVEIAITEEGFVPTTVNINAGVAVDLVFTRRTEATCAKEIVIPSLNIRKALPLNQPVTIPLPPTKADSLTFACGMNMLKGTIVVR